MKHECYTVKRDIRYGTNVHATSPSTLRKNTPPILPMPMFNLLLSSAVTISDPQDSEYVRTNNTVKLTLYSSEVTIRSTCFNMPKPCTLSTVCLCVSYDSRNSDSFLKQYL
jgi:hypothetical protein